MKKGSTERLIGLLALGALAVFALNSSSSAPASSPSTVVSSTAAGEEATTAPRVLFFDERSQVVGAIGLDGGDLQTRFKNPTLQGIKIVGISPDGKTAYAFGSKGPEQFLGVGVSLYRLSLTGTNAVAIMAEDITSVQPPAIAPNEKSYLTVQFSNAEDEFGFTLVLHAFNLSKPEVIAAEQAGVIAPTWSPDSARIYYFVPAGDSTRVRVVDAEDKKIRDLLQFPGSIQALQATSEGLLLATGAKNTAATALLAISYDGEKQTRLGTVQGPLRSLLGLEQGFLYTTDGQSNGGTVWYKKGEGSEPVVLTSGNTVLGVQGE